MCAFRIHVNYNIWYKCSKPEISVRSIILFFKIWFTLYMCICKFRNGVYITGRAVRVPIITHHIRYDIWTCSTFIYFKVFTSNLIKSIKYVSNKVKMHIITITYRNCLSIWEFSVYCRTWCYSWTGEISAEIRKVESLAKYRVVTEHRYLLHINEHVIIDKYSLLCGC